MSDRGRAAGRNKAFAKALQEFWKILATVRGDVPRNRETAHDQHIFATRDPKRIAFFA
ncbi:MAG: hypothetical protein AB3N23_08130 [Paracoccaceae bacterium]